MSREDITRRNFLIKLSAATGLVAGAGTLLSACGGGQSGQTSTPAAEDGAMAAEGCMDVSGLTDAEVQLRQSLQYTDESPVEGRTCGNCALFVAPESGASCGTCTLVKGPIAAGGYCTSWAPMPA